MQLIDSHSGLEDACRALSGAPRLYLDTEFESSREGKLLSLVQLTRGREIYLVDALRLRALEPLARVLGDTEWVLHAGAQDVPLLVERLGLREPPPLFDTQVAWALIGPEYSVSLAYLEHRLLGLRAEKTHQLDDWKRRPLPPAQLSYAAADVEHLEELQRRLSERAAALGRAEVIAEASRELLWPAPEPPTRLSLDSFRNAWQLDPHGQAALRCLVSFCNALPERERRFAPETKTLLAIASRLPESGDELARLKGVPRRFAAEHGEHLAGLIMRATAEADAADFVPIEPPPYATFEEIRVDGWLSLARASLSEELSIAPELALPSRVLRPMRDAMLGEGRADAALAGLEGWRARVLGPAFRRYAEAHPPDLRASARA